VVWQELEMITVFCCLVLLKIVYPDTVPVNKKNRQEIPDSLPVPGYTYKLLLKINFLTMKNDFYELGNNIS